MRRLLFAFLLIFCLQSGLVAQDKYKISEDDYDNNSIEMADTFRADGKIYVVVGVLTIVLVGLLSYAFIIDRRLHQLEAEANEI